MTDIPCWTHTALLIIDMQNAFVLPGQPLCVAGAQTTVPAIRKSAAVVRSHGGHVVWIRREYQADGSDMEAFRREYLRAMNALDCLSPGSFGAAPAAGLEEAPEDYIVIKKRFSGFFHTDLQHYLDTNAITTVLIAGTQTPNCVRATAFDAVSCDYRTIILADCTSSATEAIQESNLEDMKHAGIEVIPTILESS